MTTERTDLEALQRHMHTAVKGLAPVHVVAAALGVDAGVIGAAAAVLRE